MSAPLSAADVTTALAALPGWESQGTALARDIPAAEVDQETLVDAIAAIGEEMGHPATTERSPEGLHVELTTPDAGGVTARDIEVATRLDRLFSGGEAWTSY